MYKYIQISIYSRIWRILINIWIYVGLFSTPDSEQIIPENISKINNGTYVSTDKDEITLHPTVLKKRLELYLKGIFIF
jgi:hypothetical protein